ncbi:NADH dehydrogenase subunit 5 [Schinkia sp. CFF1]
MYSISTSLLLTLFFVLLILSGISGLLLLHKRVPLHFVRLHVGMVALPPVVALMGLFNSEVNNILGPWHLDRLAWLVACFVLTVGLVIQRFTIRYLLGDHSYRKYFPLFTFTTGFAAVAWLSDDFRLLIICWGLTLTGLIFLLRLNRGWKVTNVVATYTARLFAVSWLTFLSAVIWLYQVTGNWQMSHVLTNENLLSLSSWERTGINLLVIVAVMIPAAQWPFQRWLIESVVSPTPVSAIMHAGLVNAGGIILTRFSPLFNGDISQMILLIFASISVLIGTGISLVQVDYKRQLVGSTIAQMGFMLIQCALGAYIAAIIHLVLHGLFKATLFLQSGSAVHHHEESLSVNETSSKIWKHSGRALGLFVGVMYWLLAPYGGYTLISALIFGWSISFSWTRLVSSGVGKISRVAGMTLLGGFVMGYLLIHKLFDDLLHSSVYQFAEPSMKAATIIVLMLLVCSEIGIRITRNRSSAAFATLYLWAVRLGEAKTRSVESHPNYLKQYLS